VNEWLDEDRIGKLTDKEIDDFDKEITFAEALGVLIMFGFVLGGGMVILGNMIGAW
jgi:hypothetical protein